MKTRTLGKTLKVSAIGLGCMGFTHAYGPPMDESKAATAICRAFDLGYTFFDTAECYIGQRPDRTTTWNEAVVGLALKGKRDRVQIATKCGVRHENRLLVMDSRPETIRRSVEGSLQRLGTDYIDLYYQHRIDPKVPPEEVAGVMADLIRQGKILYWGISETDESYLRRAYAVCPVTAIQNRYSMMARWHEALFPVLEELSIGFVAFSPLANGLLSGAYGRGDSFAPGDYRSAMPQFSPEAYEANRALRQLVEGTAKNYNATPAQLSMAWMLAKKPYIVPIPGSRRPDRMAENVCAAEVTLTQEEVNALDTALAQAEMSAVFGGSPARKQDGNP